MEVISKRSRMIGASDISTLNGIEIGPLHSPLIRKSEGSVLYVDYASTEVVRANQHDSSINPDDIVDVDIVWGTRSLSEIINHKVDYVIASHVIEHVPDIIGWLSELHAVLKPGGVLGLAIPDRRFTFDIRRQESQLSEMIEAYLLQYRQPSIRQVFDVASLARAVDVSAAWKGLLSDGHMAPEVLKRLPDAFALAKSLSEDSRYVDAHCWVFTPGSFLDMAECLAILHLFPYVVDAFFPTEVGSLEFQIRMSSVTSASDASVIPAIRSARARLMTSSSEQEYYSMTMNRLSSSLVTV